MKTASNSTNRFFLLTIISGIAFAFVTSIDNFIIKNKVVLESDPLTAVMAYLVLGGVFGVLTQIFSTSLIGPLISREFSGLKIYSLKTMLNPIFSGFLSAVTTFFSLWASQIVDPSVVVILANVSILYIVIYDIWQKQIEWKRILIPTILIIGGSIQASLESLSSFSDQRLWLGVALLVFGRGLPQALSQIIDQIGVTNREKSQIDSVNRAFWRFCWLTIWGVAGVLLWVTVNGDFITFAERLWYFTQIAVWPIVILMVIVTIGNAALMVARELGAASEVSLLVTIQVIAIIPITVLGDLWFPGIFGDVPQGAIWLIRILGAIYVTVSVIDFHNKKVNVALPRNEAKAKEGMLG